jgi:hypothetical protein
MVPIGISEQAIKSAGPLKASMPLAHDAAVSASLLVSTQEEMA